MALSLQIYEMWIFGKLAQFVQSEFKSSPLKNNRTFCIFHDKVEHGQGVHLLFSHSQEIDIHIAFPPMKKFCKTK